MGLSSPFFIWRTYMNINWYPGHMKKTIDKLRKDIKLVDAVIELIDARIPVSSRNPVLDDILTDKPRIIIMNKSDLSNPEENDRWKAYFEKSYGVLLANSLENRGLKNLRPVLEERLGEKFERDANRKIIDKTIKIMIVGIPNVGKSTLINTIAKRAGAKVGNKPGLTRQTQWIKTSDEIELLDTPGVLWPKFEDEEGLNLAFTGAIEDRILDIENLSLKFIEKINSIDPDILKNRYNIDFEEGDLPLEILEKIAQARGALLKKGVYDYFKAANFIMGDFRSGKMGRISLETVDGK